MKRNVVLLVALIVCSCLVYAQQNAAISVSNTSMQLQPSASSSIGLKMSTGSFSIPELSKKHFLTSIQSQIDLLTELQSIKLWEEGTHHFLATFTLAAPHSIRFTVQLKEPGYIVWYVPTHPSVYIALNKEQLQEMKAAVEKVVEYQDTLSAKRNDVAKAILLARSKM